MSESLSSKNVSIDSILSFVKQSIFSKRHRFYAELDRRAQAHLIEYGKRIAWPDALSVLNDDDWTAAALTISDCVPLVGGAPLGPAYCACDDTNLEECYCRNGEVACRCDCHSETHDDPAAIEVLQAELAKERAAYARSFKAVVEVERLRAALTDLLDYGDEYGLAGMRKTINDALSGEKEPQA